MQGSSHAQHSSVDFVEYIFLCLKRLNVMMHFMNIKTALIKKFLVYTNILKVNFQRYINHLGEVETKIAFHVHFEF